jgi:prokaryotic ubiquitin-like protein Pup
VLRRRAEEEGHMTSREPGGQQHRQSQRERGHGETPADEGSEQLKERQDKLADDVDAILDDIDEVLEENAEDFVRGFVQKGGQ